MDPSIISALVGAQAGNTQLSLAADLMRMNADSARGIVQMISAAAQNANPLANAAAQSANPLANVAAGTGTNLDITA